MSDERRTILRVDGLTKNFGGIKAVRNVSLSFERGQLHSVIGPNGAGKSTFFNLLSGMYSPTKGSIYLNDVDVTRLPPEERFRRGMVRTFQLNSIFPKLSVLKNVEIAVYGRYRTSKSPWARLTKKREDIHALCIEHLERFRMVNYSGQKAGSLSYGDMRRLEILMGLVCSPDLLLLDEPTAGMSPEETAHTADVIQDIASRTTVILVEHDMKLVMRISNHITVLHQGSVLADGEPDEILNHPDVQSVYLGVSPVESTVNGGY